MLTKSAPCFCAAQGNELAWERWAYTFAQARQLGALAPTLPTDAPRLKPSTYDMVLAALLLNPAGAAARLAAACRQPAGAGGGLLGLHARGPRLPSRSLSAADSCGIPPPAEHGMLLDCVRRWPQGAYDAVQLQAAVLE